MAKDKKKTEPELTDVELHERVDWLIAAEAEFLDGNRWTRDDAREGADAWIASARGYLGASTEPSPFASRSVDLSRERILEYVAAWALGSGEFKRWLHERIEAAPSLGGSGFSGYSRDERDAELERLRGEIAETEAELERRRLTVERSRLESELAALGVDAA